MNAQKKLYATLLAAAALLSLTAGCATQTTTISRSPSHGGALSASSDDRLPGISVEVYKNELRLYGNPITQERLVKRLFDEEMSDAQKSKRNNPRGIFLRTVVLEAKDDVSRSSLIDLRNYLARNKIPRVVISTQKIAISYADEDGE